MEMFEELVGQEAAKRILASGIESGNLPQTLIFAGPQGVGRGMMARLVAQALHGSASPTHPDTFRFEEVLEDKRSRNVSSPVKSAADDMVRFLQLSPMVSKYKVAIVANAQELTEEAQSALLKALEEPRADSVIILIVENVDRLLPTILSRSQVVKFVPLTDLQLKEALGQDADPDIVKLANGSLGRARQMLSDVEMKSEISRIREFWTKVSELSLEEKFAWSEAMRDRDVAINFLEEGLRSVHGDLVTEGAVSVGKVEELEMALRKVRENANVRVALDALMLAL